MRQSGQPQRYRRKKCVCCKKLFDPDRRTKGQQRYCSNATCQTIRQRLNEKDWRQRNPECLAEQQKQSRQWHRDRPQYSLERRAKDPGLVRRNRKFTREWMRRDRAEKMFDKSKSIVTQVVGIKGGYCYLSRGGKWLLARLTKASPLSKSGGLGHNRQQFKRVGHGTVRLPAGKLYDLSGSFG